MENGRWPLLTQSNVPLSSMKMKSAYKQQSLETAYTIIYGLNTLYLGIYTKTYMPAIATDLKKKKRERDLEAEGEKESEMS